jgi:hypothetical protein
MTIPPTDLLGTRLATLRLAALLCLLLGSLAPSAEPIQASTRTKFFPGRAYADGEIIQVTGIVTDSQGEPLPNVDLALEGARGELKWRRFRKERVNPVRGTARSNERGEFVIQWRWHHYYNRFRLVAGINDRGPAGKETLVDLAQVELSTRILQGSPVVANVTIVDRTFIDRLREFLASLDTPDEQRTYQQLGRPGKVDTLRFPDREEVSWWYFDLGKTYRFVNGRIDQVVDFDPIRTPSSASP